MNIELSLLHLPIIVVAIIGLILTLQIAASDSRGFYGLELILPAIGVGMFSAFYYGLYFWFQYVTK